MNIKRIIKEEIDDFGWMGDIEINPWEEYDVIDFNIVPKREHVKKYIDMFLNTQEFNNRSAWEGPNYSSKFVVDKILEYSRDSGSTILGKEDGNFLYETRRYWNIDGLKVVKYSDLINNSRLDEEGDFDWIRDSSIDVDTDLWNQVGDILDDMTSGPSTFRGERYRNLGNILEEYNIDIEDMGDFFLYPPTDENGELIPNHVLEELKDDLMNNFSEYSDEPLEEEGSMWDNDERWGEDDNWGTDKSYWGSENSRWDNDEKWGQPEGGSVSDDGGEF